MGYDPELGWRPLPHIHKMGALWGQKRPAVMNSQGWRDAERSYEKPAGTRRIVVVGDSMVFGVGVDDGERFTEKLEQRLTRCEVLNLGVGAYGTDQELRVLELEGFRYHPDAVILVVALANDLEDIRFEWKDRWPKPYYTLRDGELILTKPQPSWKLTVRMTSQLVEFVSQQWRRFGADTRYAPGGDTMDPVILFTALVRRMAAECAQREVPFFVVLAYDGGQLLSVTRERDWRIRAALKEARIPTLDTFYSNFHTRARAGENLYHADGVHWNERGHEVIADELREMLAKNGWLD